MTVEPERQSCLGSKRNQPGLDELAKAIAAAVPKGAAG